MAKEKRARERKGRYILIPPQDMMEERRRQLPNLEPYNTQELISDARALAESEGMDLDRAVKVVRYVNQKHQVEQLLRGLGCDASEPDWQRAFLTLAR